MKIVDKISDDELIKEVTNAIRDFIISLEIKCETDHKYTVLEKMYNDWQSTIFLGKFIFLNHLPRCCKIFPNAKEPTRIYPLSTA